MLCLIPSSFRLSPSHYPHHPRYALRHPSVLPMVTLIISSSSSSSTCSDRLPHHCISLIILGVLCVIRSSSRSSPSSSRHHLRLTLYHPLILAIVPPSSPSSSSSQACSHTCLLNQPTILSNVLPMLAIGYHPIILLSVSFIIILYTESTSCLHLSKPCGRRGIVSHNHICLHISHNLYITAYGSPV